MLFYYILLLYLFIVKFNSISETIMDGVKGSFQYKYGNPDNIEVDPNEPSLGVADRGGE